ncbi:COP9 signalosome (CSN) subunit [Bachmanniomyces sp. S44760]|nr:COP9 signalosome (CSN) subunit [Bachmanniomyces sp. S44760]
MDILFRDFQQAHLLGSGPLLSTTIAPIAPPNDPTRLENIFRSSNALSIHQDVRSGLLAHSNTALRFSKAEGTAWVEVYVAYWKSTGELLSIENTRNRDWVKVYESWKELTNALIRGYSGAGFLAWTIPCLYIAARYLRVFAIKADEHSSSLDNLTFNAGAQDDITDDYGKNEHLEDAARVINRIFTICISDRAPLEESRKWGLYFTTNLLFKTYFKLNSISLSKNILRALQAGKADMPPMEAFPKSHIVTFNYYVGVILFLEEDYANAERHLTDAMNMCHRAATRNRELILTYLIPCHLLTTHTLPTAHLLGRHPRLQFLFGDLNHCIKKGDLAGFDVALAAGEDEFVKRRVYLTLERGRDITLRNLLRKVFLNGGFEEAKPGDDASSVRRTRVSLAEFVAAIRLGSQAQGEKLEDDEVECLLANMIYKVCQTTPQIDA